ncbi:MAG: LacI family DNA-binding transcriptional regulator [Hymenobacter sp.]
MAKKRVSITDLARQLNISVSTISRALSGHSAISEATVKRVTDLAKELGYQPNSLASGLRKGRSNMLGVLVPHIDGNFFSQVVKGIEAARQQGRLPRAHLPVERGRGPRARKHRNPAQRAGGRHLGVALAHHPRVASTSRSAASATCRWCSSTASWRATT